VSGFDGWRVPRLRRAVPRLGSWSVEIGVISQFRRMAIEVRAIRTRSENSLVLDGAEFASVEVDRRPLVGQAPPLGPGELVTDYAAVAGPDRAWWARW
jgi:hypothetical protein